MTRYSSSQHACLPFCIKLVNMGARAVTLSRVARLPAEMARKLCRDMGKETPPGQTPDDVSFFTQNPSLRRQGALLLLLYHAFRSHYDRFSYEHPLSPYGHLIGITLAYSTYRRCFTSDAVPPVNIERFEMLASGYNLPKKSEFAAGVKEAGQEIASWRKIPSGGTGLHERKIVRKGFEKLSSTKVMSCRICRIPHLVEGYRLAQWSCNDCVRAAKAAKKAEKEAKAAERRERRARSRQS